MGFWVTAVTYLSVGLVLQRWWWEAQKRWIAELVRWGLVDPAAKQLWEGSWWQRSAGLVRSTRTTPNVLRATLARDDELPKPCVERRGETDRRRRFFFAWMLAGWIACVVLGAAVDALVA